MLNELRVIFTHPIFYFIFILFLGFVPSEIEYFGLAFIPTSEFQAVSTAPAIVLSVLYTFYALYVCINLPISPIWMVGIFRRATFKLFMPLLFGFFFYIALVGTLPMAYTAAFGERYGPKYDIILSVAEDQTGYECTDPFDYEWPGKQSEAICEIYVNDQSKIKPGDIILEHWRESYFGTLYFQERY